MVAYLSILINTMYKSPPNNNLCLKQLNLQRRNVKVEMCSSEELERGEPSWAAAYNGNPHDNFKG